MPIGKADIAAFFAPRVAKKKAPVEDTDSATEPQTAQDESPVRKKANKIAAMDDASKPSPARTEAEAASEAATPAKPEAMDVEQPSEVKKEEEVDAAAKDDPAEEQQASLPASSVPTASFATAATQDEGEDMDEADSDDSDDSDDDKEEDAAPSSTSAGGKKVTLSTLSGKKKKADTATGGATNVVAAGFDPVAAATWKAGEPVPYQALAQLFKRVEETSKRLIITDMVTKFLRSVIALTPADFTICVYLLCNKLAPAFEGVELGIGESILAAAISTSCGRKASEVKKQLIELGDLGIVAENSRSTQSTIFKPKPLTVREVIKVLREIAKETKQEPKKRKITKLLTAAQGPEARYVVRALQGKLRIGLAEATVLVAIAHAGTLTPPGKDGKAPAVLDVASTMSADKLTEELEAAVATVKQVYSELPSYDVVLGKLLEYGVKNLEEHCYLQPGVPVKPMLAKPTRGISEVLDRFGGISFTCEYKYDGERAQIHYQGDGKLNIYSRGLEDHTPKYPELTKVIPLAKADGVEVTSFVMDSEVVAYDVENKKILPFQQLSTRARKVVDEKDIKVQVCIYAFDLLYINGRSLIRENFKTRRAEMMKHFKVVEGKFQFATNRDSADTEELLAFLNESIKASCEGLMVKTLEENATYEPSKRSLNWLKVKKDYLDSTTDTIDVVPIAAWHGEGKRTGVYGAYLLGIYDAETEEYQSLTKIGTGFSDDDLQKHTEFLKQHVVSSKPDYYQVPEEYVGTKNKGAPAVWFSPEVVWEIKGADFSISPAHKAAVGLVHESKGIAVRFPRFLRIRDDKGPEDATGSDQIADMYNSQAVVQ